MAPHQRVQKEQADQTPYLARLHLLVEVAVADLQAQAVQTLQVLAVDRAEEMLTKEMELEALETHHL